jgi:hypothetical protein
LSKKGNFKRQNVQTDYPFLRVDSVIINKSSGVEFNVLFKFFIDLFAGND